MGIKLIEYLKDIAPKPTICATVASLIAGTVAVVGELYANHVYRMANQLYNAGDYIHAAQEFGKAANIYTGALGAAFIAGCSTLAGLVFMLKNQCKS